MKKCLMMIAVCLLAAPANADDVPQQTLSALGLGEMTVMSDDAGMQVRGLSSNASAMGLSLTFGQLVYIDQFGQNFQVASDVNAAMATAENAGLNAFSTATSTQGSAIFGSLLVLPTGVTPGFNGAFTGLAGNAANPFGGTANAFAF